MNIAGCHPDDLIYYPISSGRHNIIWNLSHPGDYTIGSISSRWLMANVLCHPDDMRSFPKSSGWHKISWTVCHLDEIVPDCISSGWLMAGTLCHPDDLAGVVISSEWVMTNSLCHSNDIPFYPRSSIWLNWGWYLIRVNYGKVIMSSGWDTYNFLSHQMR